jgi:hypothetical protein
VLLETVLAILLVLVVTASAWFLVKARADGQRAVAVARLQSDLAVAHTHV